MPSTSKWEPLFSTVNLLTAKKEYFWLIWLIVTLNLRVMQPGWIKELHKLSLDYFFFFFFREGGCVVFTLHCHIFAVLIKTIQDKHRIKQNSQTIITAKSQGLQNLFMIDLWQKKMNGGVDKWDLGDMRWFADLLSNYRTKNTSAGLTRMRRS